MSLGIWRALCSLTVAVSTLIASGANASQVSGEAVTVSPSMEMLASWTLDGSVVTFFDVDENSAAGKYNAHFPVNSVTFSLSGRFVCISSKDPVRKLAIIDVQGGFRKAVSIADPTLDGLYCTETYGPASLNRTLPAGSRPDSLVGTTQYTRTGGPCGTASMFNLYLIRYWDPRGKVGKVVSQYRGFEQVC